MKTASQALAMRAQKIHYHTATRTHGTPTIHYHTPVCTAPTVRPNMPCGLFDPAYPCGPMGHSNKRYHGLGRHEALYTKSTVQALAMVQLETLLQIITNTLFKG